MENAGTSVVQVLEKWFGEELKKARVVVLCGKGNNGGDGLVVARLLKQQGAEPMVILFSSPEATKGDALVNLQRWQEMGGLLRSVTNETEWRAAREILTHANLIVDALLGTGINGAVGGLLAKVIEDTNSIRESRRSKLRVVAVDMPSGLSADSVEQVGPVLGADQTITFSAPKIGQLAGRSGASVGRLSVVPIGTPRKILDEGMPGKTYWIEPGEFRLLPLERRADAHKGDYGHALIVAGSRGKSGAAVLAAWAALRAGAGLVTVATPDNVLPIVAAGLAEMMTAPLEETETGTISLSNLEYARFAGLVKGKSVLAIGPGLTTQIETQQFVRAIVSTTALPMVLDADGLNAFAGRADDLKKREGPAMVITPHPGEMARLLERRTDEIQERRLEVALEAATRWNVFVVLKGQHTIVATPDGRAFFNSTGNPGMATGGTGDVLTGLLAGLTAQFGIENWERVLSFGVYIHGLAGDLAAARVGEAPLIASDLIAEIPAAYERVRSEIRRVAD